MSEDRLSTLETLVTDLRINEAKYTTAVCQLTDSVEKLTAKVDELTAALDRGKGAVWVLAGGAGGLIGWASSWISKHLA